MRNRRFNQSAYRRNIRKALGRPIKAGETTAFADNGDLVVYGPHGVIGLCRQSRWTRDGMGQIARQDHRPTSMHLDGISPISKLTRFTASRLGFRLDMTNMEGSSHDGEV